MRSAITKTIFLYFLLHSFTGYSQTHIIDSLDKVLRTQKEDTNKVNTLIELAREYRHTKGDTAIYFIDQALTLAKKLDNEMEIADSKRMVGTLYAQQGRCDDGVQACNEALALYNKLLLSAKAGEKEEILRKIGLTYNEIGNNRFTQGNYPEALKNFFYALEIKEQAGDKAGIAAMEFNIGNVYYCQHNYSEALKHDFASLKINEQSGDKAQISICYDAIGIAYFDAGNYAEASKNYAISLKLAEESKDIYAMAEIYIDVGVMYEKEENYTRALKYDFAALKICEEIKLVWQIPFIYNNIGSVFIKQKKYNEAYSYLNKALSTAKYTNHSEYIKLAYQNLAILDSTQGNYKSALEHYRLFITYRDSLINKENTTKLVQSQMQYDFDKKEAIAKAAEDKKEAIARAEIQNQKTIRNFSYTGAFALLSFAGVGFYRYRRRKKIQSQQEMLHERLRISRELHDDIGSTLGSISIYSEVAKNRTEKNENPDEAISKIGIASRELIDKMSDIVWSLNPNNESFEQLLNRIQVFAAIMLTPHEILYTIYTDEAVKSLKLSTEERKNIYLIYKEAIHNVIKYAECTQVEIKMLLNADEFLMTIKDNGKGFNISDAKLTSESLGGNGIKNMQARAADIKAKFNISCAINEGTTIELILKL